MNSYQIGRITKLDRSYYYSTVEYNSDNNEYKNYRTETRTKTRKHEEDHSYKIIVITSIIRADSVRLS